MLPEDDFDDMTDDSVARDFMARLKPGTPEFEELKASLEEAVAELDRGEGTPLDFEEIKRKGREMLAQRRKDQTHQ